MNDVAESDGRLFDVSHVGGKFQLVKVTTEPEATPEYDLVERALAWSADDPDGPYPEWVRRGLHMAATEHLSPREALPWWPEVPPEPAYVPRAEQLGLDTFAATPAPPVQSEEDAQDEVLDALLAAHRRNGTLPVLDDVHHGRRGLPGIDVVERAGGWPACIVMARAMLAVA